MYTFPMTSRTFDVILSDSMQWQHVKAYLYRCNICKDTFVTQLSYSKSICYSESLSTMQGDPCYEENKQTNKTTNN